MSTQEYTNVAGEAKIGQAFLFDGEKFMRIKMAGCGSLVKVDKACRPHKVLAVSLENHDLIVLDRLDAFVCLLNEYPGSP